MLKALAAIGQCKLMAIYDNLFGFYRQPIAQILLTRNDIADVRLHVCISGASAQNGLSEPNIKMPKIRSQSS